MTFEHKPNRGSMFKNDEKESENHPDSKGSALIGGVEYWVAGWRNAPEGKKPYLSLSFQPKDKDVATAQEQDADAAKDDPILDDEIPF